MLQAKLSSLPPKLQNQVSALQTVQRYENRQLQCQALNEIPVCTIDASTTQESYELSFMKMSRPKRLDPDVSLPCIATVIVACARN
eukprot:g29079.t1